jgi:hypothetical protein
MQIFEVHFNFGETHFNESKLNEPSVKFCTEGKLQLIHMYKSKVIGFSFVSQKGNTKFLTNILQSFL